MSFAKRSTGGRTNSIRSDVSRLSLAGEQMQIRRASTDREEWRRMSNSSAMEDEPVDEALNEAEMDEDDALAAPASDLHNLLHKAVDSVVMIRRSVDNYTHDMTTKLKKRVARRSSDVPNFDDEDTGEESNQHIKRQVTELERAVLMAIDLSKRVQRGMEIKTAATTKAKTRATETSGLLEAMKREVEAASSIVAQKDAIIQAKVDEIREQAEKATVRANAEREWWEQKLKEAHQVTEKVKEEMEMELQYALENASAISSSNEALLRDRIASLETTLHKLTVQSAEQINTMKETHAKAISTMQAEHARAVATYESNYESLQQDYYSFVADHEEAEQKHKEEVENLHEQAEGFKSEIETLADLYKETEELANRIAAEKAELEQQASASTERLEELTTLLSDVEGQLEQLRVAAAEKEAELQEQLEELQEELDRIKKANDFTRIRGMCIDALARYVQESWMRVAWARMDRWRIYAKGARKIREIEAAVRDFREQLTTVQGLLKEKEEELEHATESMRAQIEEQEALNAKLQEEKEKNEMQLRRKIEELRSEVDEQKAAVAAWVKRHREEEAERERERQRQLALKQKQAQQPTENPNRQALVFLNQYRSLIEFLVQKHRMRKFNMDMLELPNKADGEGEHAGNEKEKKKIDCLVFKMATSVSRLFARLLEVERRLRHVRVRANVTTVWDRIKLRREKRLEKKRHMCPQSTELCRQQILYLQARVNVRESIMHAALIRCRKIFTEADPVFEQESIQFAMNCEAEVDFMQRQSRAELDKLSMKASLSVSRTVWALIKGGLYIYPEQRGGQTHYSLPQDGQPRQLQISPRGGGGSGARYPLAFSPSSLARHGGGPVPPGVITSHTPGVVPRLDLLQNAVLGSLSCVGTQMGLHVTQGPSAGPVPLLSSPRGGAPPNRVSPKPLAPPPLSNAATAASAAVKGTRVDPSPAPTRSISPKPSQTHATPVTIPPPAAASPEGALSKRSYYTAITAGGPYSTRTVSPPSAELSSGAASSPSPYPKPQAGLAVAGSSPKKQRGDALKDQLSKTAPLRPVSGVEPRTALSSSGPNFCLGPTPGSPPQVLPPRAATAGRASRVGRAQFKFHEAAANPVVVKDAGKQQRNPYRKRGDSLNPLTQLLNQASSRHAVPPNTETVPLVLKGIQTLPLAGRAKSPPQKSPSPAAHGALQGVGVPIEMRPPSAAKKHWASKPSNAPFLSVQGGSVP